MIENLTSKKKKETGITLLALVITINFSRNYCE